MDRSLAHTKWMCKYHIILPEVPKEDNIQQNQEGYCRYHQRAMQVQGRGDIGLVQTARFTGGLDFSTL